MANEIKWYDDPHRYTLFSIKPGQGPSKMDLLNAFMYAYGGEFRVPPDPMRVQFKVVRGSDPERCDVVMNMFTRILGISHENNSGSSFNFFGYVSAAIDWNGASSNEREFRGYYNTRTRTGTIKMKNHD